MIHLLRLIVYLYVIFFYTYLYGKANNRNDIYVILVSDSFALSQQIFHDGSCLWKYPTFCIVNSFGKKKIYNNPKLWYCTPDEQFWSELHPLHPSVSISFSSHCKKIRRHSQVNSCLQLSCLLHKFRKCICNRGQQWN